MPDNKAQVPITTGCVVRSLAGRDSSRYFIVSGAPDDRHVYLTDGRTRKVEHPKMKKLKHILYVGPADRDIADRISRGKLTNSIVRKYLSSLSESSEEGVEETGKR